MKELPKSQLNWMGVRFLDPLGKVFEFEGRYIRAIYRHKISFIEYLFSSKVLESLETKGLTCKFSRVSDINLDGFDLLIEQHAAPFELSIGNWSLDTIKEAALNYLSINLVLLDFDLGLNDGHAGNFALFGNSKPKFFDLGSVVKIKKPHHGLDEFCRHFLHPLVLASKGKNLGRITRLLCQNGGIGFKESHDLLNFKFDYPSNRKETLLFLQNIIRKITYNTPENSLWQDYQNDTHIESEVKNLIDGKTQDPRNVAISGLLKAIKPTKVTDIGCNSGFFSLLSAMLGAKVFAFDSDEGAIKKFCYNLKNNWQDFDITIGINKAETVNLIDKNKSDLVLALALSHHLFFSCKFKFDHIAKCLSSYSNKFLITEFMPNGLGGVAGPNPNPLPTHYNLEEFVRCLSKYFGKVDIIDYDMPEGNSPRTLIFCSKKSKRTRL